jgi:hypothetical protein
MLPPLFRIACLVSALAALLGSILTWSLVGQPLTQPTLGEVYNFYLYTFARFEPFPLGALTAFFLGILLIRRGGLGKWEDIFRSLVSKRLPLLVAVTVLIFTSIGRFTIHQNFDLCIDEYLNELEGQILQRDHLVAEVPQPWIAYRTALQLPYQIYKGTETQGYWASGFLPGFAVLDHTFDLGRVFKML